MSRADTRLWVHPTLRILWIAFLFVASALPSFAAPSAVSPYESVHDSDALSTVYTPALKERDDPSSREERKRKIENDKKRTRFFTDLLRFESISLRLVPDPTLGPQDFNAEEYGQAWIKKGKQKYKTPNSYEEHGIPLKIGLTLDEYPKTTAGPVKTFDAHSEKTEKEKTRKGNVKVRRASSKKVDEPLGILRLVQGFQAQEKFGPPYAMPGYTFLARETGWFNKKRADAVVVTMPGGMTEAQSRSTGSLPTWLEERDRLVQFQSLVKAVKALRDKGMYHLNLHPSNIFFDQGKAHVQGNQTVDLKKVWLTGFEHVTKAPKVKHATGSRSFAAPGK